jgi:hypothetical protein
MNLRPYRVIERGRLNWRLILERVIGSRSLKLGMLLISGADGLMDDLNMYYWNGCSKLLPCGVHVKVRHTLCTLPSNKWMDLRRGRLQVVL